MFPIWFTFLNHIDIEHTRKNIGKKNKNYVKIYVAMCLCGSSL
jgi:hypothetical protein